MNPSELRGAQRPLKIRYQQDPAAARITLSAQGIVDDTSISCQVGTRHGVVTAGLHPATGGDGSEACSGDMLLEALVACAGVTLRAVATALAVSLRRAVIGAEGELDFRGTLGVARDVPVGFERIRLRFELETDASPEQMARMVELTERYCVILQTLRRPPRVEVVVLGS